MRPPKSGQNDIRINAVMPDIMIPSSDDNEFSGYMALPAKLPAPAVIVIQEIFGVNANMRALCDEIAAQGFVALCPDLFWRIERNVNITDRTQAEWDKAFDLFGRFDLDMGVKDLDATLQFLKNDPNVSGNVGCVGFCLGGKLAYLMATRTNIDAAVSYYGVQLDQFADEAAKIKKPIILHIASEDKFFDKTAQKTFLNATSDNPLIVSYVYEGNDHAFARIGGDHYDADAAEKANARTYAFLRGQLEL
jgi:carboxymethylenebutenolidase